MLCTTPKGWSQDPFERRIPVPELPTGMQWLNTNEPLKLRDLRGKFVLLDFWTYCCINCMHVLPELKKLEKKYGNQLVVIGVHSAKFTTEKEIDNISEAILRYEIEHPVVNDDEHRLWTRFGVSSWPTTILIDPEGNAVAGRSGEFEAPEYEKMLDAAIPFYRKRGSLNETPIKFSLLAAQQPSTPLRFPGKVLADETSNRLFIADSNHNRIVVTDLEGALQVIIGSGRIGQDDGGFAECSFNHPQGMALNGSVLWVADTENHLIREVDLETQRVRTVAGVGTQGRNPFPGHDPAKPLSLRGPWAGQAVKTALSSPWDLHWHRRKLLVAMAGFHQIWCFDPKTNRIGPIAGNGREDIVDGPLLPQEPLALGSSSFAQPSGLASDGRWLYVADSEGSSIRAVPSDPKQLVRTVVGTAHLPQGRLFVFGDTEGALDETQLQHVLDVEYHDGNLFVADAYNNKIKRIDLAGRIATTLAGTGRPGKREDPPEFDEPAGLSYAADKLYVADTNNHVVRVIHLKEANRVTTLVIDGLLP
jgi:thiol-disulfide isomerase/thioredoxin